MMHWTTDKPTTPGWYWHRDLQHVDGIRFPRVVAICAIKGTLCVFGLVPKYFVLVNASGEWSSAPIEEPEEER